MGSPPPFCDCEMKLVNFVARSVNHYVNEYHRTLVLFTVKKGVLQPVSLTVEQIFLA